jgi:hypothetical protein
MRAWLRRPIVYLSLLVGTAAGWGAMQFQLIPADV